MSKADSTTTVVGRARDLARRIRELASTANSQGQGIIAQLLLEELAAPVVLLAGVKLEVAVFEMLERVSRTLKKRASPSRSLTTKRKAARFVTSF